jgi:hypothetical protein
MVWFPSLALSPYISWKLEEGDWTWLKLELKEIVYNPDSANL